MLNTDLSGKDSAQLDGAVINVSGIPAGGSVTVSPVMQTRSAGVSAAQAAVEATFAEYDWGKNSSQLFMWNISVQDPNGTAWQPFAKPVTVEVELPGVKLHPYTKVYVIHVSDHGVSESIPATVTEDGGLVFETKGFSTFAGFTVDFEYDNVKFSINGLTSILLSELFEHLQMPLYVSDVAGVQFSDTSLVTVTAKDGDWELKSLKAFDTNETLTLTMVGGEVYTIKVTDAAVKITINGVDYDDDNNDTCSWWITTSTDGKAYTQNTTKDADGWDPDRIIHVSGSGTFHIALQRKAGYTGDTLYVDIHQIRNEEGAKLLFDMGASINPNGATVTYANGTTVTYPATKKVVVTGLRGQTADDSTQKYRSMFYVENGALDIVGKSGVELVIKGGTTDGKVSYDESIIQMDPGATNLNVQYATFKDSNNGALHCYANEASISLDYCSFANSVNRTAYKDDEGKSQDGGNGGAIYIVASTDGKDTGGYVDIHNFSVTNCTFDGNDAAAQGGAIGVYGSIHNGLIKNCTFSACDSTTGGGGAIAITGRTGYVCIENCTFTSCTSKTAGGAITTYSRQQEGSGNNINYSRINELAIKSCTFTNCQSTGSRGGAICISGELGVFTMSGTNSFSNCTASNHGGAIAFDYTNLSSVNSSGNKVDKFGQTNHATWVAEVTQASCTTCQAANTYLGANYNMYYTFPAKDREADDAISTKTSIGSITIKGTTSITNCSSGNSGGGLDFGSYTSYSTISLSGLTIDGCSTKWSGSAIYLGQCVLSNMTVSGCTFQNCDFTEKSNVEGATFFGEQKIQYPAGNSGQAGGTFRTIGKTTGNVSISNCNFLNNKSRVHGGGVYWNANYRRNGLDGSEVTCQLAISGCTFDGNLAAEYGGGIYCEGTMDISDCRILNNKAYVRGGGIAQQVYNNADAYLMVGYEKCDLTLDTTTYVFNNYGGRGGGISIRANASNSISGNVVDANGNEVKDENGNPISIASTITVEFKLGGASVYSNQAETNGGGVCFIAEDDEEAHAYTKSILIDSGNIWDNEAIGNGGGIYMQSSENTSLQIDGGFISGNTANIGGGIFMNGKNATCYIYGGTIGGKKLEGSTNPGMEMPNKALVNAEGKGGNGGAIALTGGATIKMMKRTASDGTETSATISYNIAERKGGAIFLRSTDANNIPNVMEFEDGTIIYNTSGIDYANTPGMEEKTAPTDAHGGGIFVGAGGQFTLTNGILQENKALYGNGGAVYGNGATITIGKSDGTGSGQIIKNSALGGGGIAAANDASITVYGGKINENTANRGGGIHVSDGADLNVQGGYVTFNKATGTCNQTTGYLLDTELMGTGGGIYIVNGVAATDTAEANPTTFTMDGTGVAIYGNIADFAADDVFANGNLTKLNVPIVEKMDMSGFNEDPEGWFEDYAIGDTSYAEGLKRGTGGYRYKKATAALRVEVGKDNSNVLLANAANEYVCMTLGVAMAIDDTVVLDFGLPVHIQVLGNESAIKSNNAYIAGISMSAPVMEGNFTTALLDPFNNTQFNTAGYDIVVNSNSSNVADENDYIYFRYKQMVADSEITFWYSVYYQTGERFYYASVTVVPATTIYFEDNAGVITYEEYTLSKDADGKTVISAPTGGTWGTTPAMSGAQDMDVPGINANTNASSALAKLDADNIYGYDSAYNSINNHSLGSSKNVTVNANKSAGAIFSFKGTGFDVISMTDSTSGLIMVTVTGVKDTDTADYKKTFVVDNYYKNGSIYQVPIMKVKLPAYGEYNVKIYIAYAEPFDHDKDQQCTFYLDAIRIYDPAQGNEVVENFHEQDGELWPTYRELRNMLIEAEDFDITDDSVKPGAVFIDQHQGQISVSTYQNFGPNNELYLAKGQSVAFTLSKDGSTVNKIHLGMRGIGGKANVKIFTTEEYTLNDAPAMEVNSTTDMYYDITKMDGKTVVIYNAGDTILSITNVKTTHNRVAATSDDVIVYNGRDVENALAAIAPESVLPTITPAYPTLNFASEIRYNVYFTALNMGDVALENIGLAIFDGAQADGTVDTAVELVPGAVFDGEKYMVHTSGIPAKELGDVAYFKIYVKTADGTYVYSDLLAYSAVAYAEDILANSDNTEMKSLVVAMLNHGAAAQKHFGYKTETLMNAGLTAEQQALVGGYTDGMVSTIPAVGADKMGQFTFNGGYTDAYPSVSFEGAFGINYYFTPAGQPEGNVTLYYWTEEAYANADVLRAENASGSIVMEPVNGRYVASVEDIYARQIDEAVYVAGVYTANGTTYCTGVIGYSLGAYCLDRITNATGTMQDLAKATVIYGECAKTYFAQM